MKQLIPIIIVSFDNVNFERLMINKQFLTKIGGNKKF